MRWLIALGVLIVLAALPLGVRVVYDQEGPQVRLILGPVRMTLYPRPRKEQKKEKAEKGEKQTPRQTADGEQLPQPPQPPQEPKKKKAEKQGGSLLDFLPLVKTALDPLGDLRRKLRMDDLELKLSLAGDDPCDLGVNYGRAWALVGALLPQLERLFVIKKRDIEVECDFTASKTLIFARMELTITLGRLLTLAVRYGFRALKEFLTIQKKRKGGAVT